MQCQFKKLVSMRGNALPLCSICCEMLGKYGGPITLPCGESPASCARRRPTHCFTTESSAQVTGLPSHLTTLSCWRKNMRQILQLHMTTGHFAAPPQDSSSSAMIASVCRA